MKKKRSILCCLLCMLLSLYGAFSSYAYSVASKSDADYYMHNAQEFVPNFVPMKTDLATKSDADLSILTSPALRTSSGVQAVVNTVDLTSCSIRCHNDLDSSSSTRISGSFKYLGTNGHYSFISESSNIKRFVIDIPHESLPQSGKYLMSYSFISDVAYSYENIDFVVYKTSDNAWQLGKGVSSMTPDHMDNSGSFYRSPALIDFSSVQKIAIVCDPDDAQDVIGGNFAMRFAISDSTSTSTSVGFEPPSTEESSQVTAQNTAELVYSQNETNGLLEDIIQHISDQLAAMWDQIYNLMAVPWIQNDNQRTNNTIEAIEENSENTQTVIEQQSSWHANFIIDGLKSLFIPDDDYFESVRTDLSSWFEQHFGFLAQSINYFVRILNVFIVQQESSIIRFPGISVPNLATGETYVILQPRNIYLSTEMSRLGNFDFSTLFPNYPSNGFPSSINLRYLVQLASKIVLTLYLIQMFIDKLHKIEGM